MRKEKDEWEGEHFRGEWFRQWKGTSFTLFCWVQPLGREQEGILNCLVEGAAIKQ